MPYKKIGVIVADKDEYAPFKALIADAKDITTPFKSAFKFTVRRTEVISVCCGIGKVNAAACAMYLCDNGCDCILNFGLSGGIKGVNRSDFILPDRFLEHDFDLTALGYKPCEKPGQTFIYNADGKLVNIMSGLPFVKCSGTAVCGDIFISDKKTAEFLSDTFGASSCDMETGAIASVCHITKTPFVALRRISDGADGSAEDEYKEMNENDGITLAGAFIKCLNAVCEER